MKTPPCMSEFVPGSRPDPIPFPGGTGEAYPENAAARFCCCQQLHCQQGTSCWEASICQQLDPTPLIHWGPHGCCVSLQTRGTHTPHTPVLPFRRVEGPGKPQSWLGVVVWWCEAPCNVLSWLQAMEMSFSKKQGCSQR